jgi:hypothetical protein
LRLVHTIKAFCMLTSSWEIIIKRRNPITARYKKQAREQQ